MIRGILDGAAPVDGPEPIGPPAPVDDRPLSVLVWARAAVLPLVGLAGGVFVGYLMTRQASAPGDLQALVYFWLVPIGLVALMLILAGAAGRATVSHPTAAPTQAAALGVAVIVGVVSGIGLTRALGLTYPPVLHFEATGPASLTLNGAAAFLPDPTATATCASVGGKVVDRVVIPKAGTFRGETVVVSLFRDPTGEDDELAVAVGGQNLPPAIWDGAPRETTSDDGRSGGATFDGLAVSNPNGLPLPGTPVPGDWPATITGTLSWSCGALAPVEASGD